jgi:hypothetical protein
MTAALPDDIVRSGLSRVGCRIWIASGEGSTEQQVVYPEYVAGGKNMEVPQTSVEWILNILISLLVPGVVWATVIAGLILVIRDRMEEDDMIQYLKGSAQSTSPIIYEVGHAKCHIGPCNCNSTQSNSRA